MSDRRADDDTQPLLPRRTLDAPAGASPATAQATAPARTQDAPQSPVVDGPVRAQDESPVRTRDVPLAAAESAGTGAASSGQSVAAPGGRVPPPSRPTVRKARLRVVRFDPWSVMKMAFALSMAIAVVIVVAVTVLWMVLSVAGVWDAINDAVSAALESDSSSFDVTNYVGLDRVLGVTMVIAAVDVILITALATLGAFLYNLAASLLGGLEVTLAEDR